MAIIRSLAGKRTAAWLWNLAPDQPVWILTRTATASSISATPPKAEELIAVLDRVSRFKPLAGHEHDAQRDKELPPKDHYPKP